MNFNRIYSDERGVNCIQALVMVNCALGAMELLPPNPARRQRLLAGFEMLTNATNQVHPRALAGGVRVSVCRVCVCRVCVCRVCVVCA